MGMPTPFNIFCIVMGLISLLAYGIAEQWSVSISFDAIRDVIIIGLLIIALRRQSDVANRLGKNQKALAAKLDKISNVIK